MDDVNKNYADYFIEELNQLGIDPVSTQWFYGKPENLSKFNFNYYYYKSTKRNK